jgi:hypothetical protein
MSAHHAAIKWANDTARHRKRIAAARVVTCIQCGGPIDTQLDPWDVGHVVDLAAGGSAADVGPSHRRCNRSAGGRLGAQITHAKRRAASRRREW